MIRTVVDTDVFSYSQMDDREAPRFRRALGGSQIVLSFQTVAELFKWTVVRDWGPKRITALEAALGRCIIVPYDRDMAWAWAEITGECHKRGREISAGDAWIAAAAVRYDLPLLTNNVAHYRAAEEFCGLRILSGQPATGEAGQ